MHSRRHCGPLLCVSRYLGLNVVGPSSCGVLFLASQQSSRSAGSGVSSSAPWLPRLHFWTWYRCLAAVCSPCFSRYPSSTSAPNCNSHLEPKRCTLCEYTDNAHAVHMMHYTQPCCIMLALFFTLSVIHFCAQLQLASRAGTLCEYTDDAHDVHMMHYATGGGDKSWIHVKNA